MLDTMGAIPEVDPHAIIRREGATNTRGRQYSVMPVHTENSRDPLPWAADTGFMKKESEELIF